MRSFLILNLFLFQIGFSQSDISVPYQSLVQANPSFAGSNGGSRNQTFAHLQSAQWGDYYTINNAFDAYLPALKSGVAFSTNHTNLFNILRNNSAGLTYAKYFKLGDKLRIIPSLQAEYTVKQLSLGWYSNSVYSTGNPPEVRREYLSLNGGLLVNYKNLYAGLSIFNFNRPDVGFYTDEEKLSPRYNLHISYNLNVSENLRVNIYGQYFEGHAYSRPMLAVNALFYKHFLFGLSRTNDAFGINLGLRTNYFTGQISHQYNLSGLMPDNYPGSWQATLSFNLRNKELRNSVTNFEAW